MRDQIIIFCYEYYSEEEIKRHAPKIVQVNEKNRIVGRRNADVNPQTLSVRAPGKVHGR